MDYTLWVWYDQETYHLFLALLSERLDYKEGISNNQTPRDLKAIPFFFFFRQTTGEKKSMIKKRQILSSRRSGELSWTRKVAGRDVGFGWFWALGKSLDPLRPQCHCHTRARRHLGWTQSLHGAHISLLVLVWPRRRGGRSWEPAWHRWWAASQREERQGVRWETVWRAVVEPNAVCLHLSLESEPVQSRALIFSLWTGFHEALSWLGLQTWGCWSLFGRVWNF